MKQKWFNTTRIGGISDGVFAIAMTLLVLELKLPEMEVSVPQPVFLNAIIKQLPHFISWIISFAILCRLWIIHHALLEQGDSKSRHFTSFNFIFLGVISFIPFPTSLISQHPDQPLSVVIFSLTYLVAWVAMIGMWRSQKKEDAEAFESSSEKQFVRRIIVLMPLIVLASCLLAMIEPRLGVLVWVIFLVIGRVANIRQK
jgi:TMEM175 potassium channel family protein